MICPECEMYYVEWRYTPAQAQQLFKNGTVAPEPMVPHFHVCPEPYSYETAKCLADSLTTLEAVIAISPTQKAKIVLGLKRGESAST
jgi:hypothetical protein